MRYLSLLIYILFYSAIADAATIVRMEIQQDGISNNIDLKLFERVAPNTVSSFLKYSDVAPVISVPPAPTESYVDTFIHKISNDVTLEGGQFTFTPASGAFECTGCSNALSTPSAFIYSGGLQLLSVDLLDENALLDSEFARSNVRGTIGMKKASALKSSPSIWFINLADNASGLDIFTGDNNDVAPLTVFGDVINNTMQAVDGISLNVNTVQENLSIIHFDLLLMPLVNYVLGSVQSPNPVNDANLVKVKSVTSLFTVVSDISSSVNADTDFSFVLNNTDNTAVITVNNIGTENIHVNSIADIDPIDAPYSFSISNNACTEPTPITLAPAENCSFEILLNSLGEGEFAESFNIEIGIGDGLGLSKSSISYNHTLFVSVVDTIQPILTVSEQSLDFGLVFFETSTSEFIDFTNTGTADLDITSVQVIGDNASEFSFSDNCVDFSPYAPNTGCRMIVEFSPVTTGAKQATLVINSNDPNQAVLNIQLIGAGDSDTDGIEAAIENAAPGNGDNNNDGIQDAEQNNVVSLEVGGGRYLSLVVEEGLGISGIVLNPEVSFNEPVPAFPEEFDFSFGSQLYSINVNEPGDIIEVGVILPAGIKPEQYFMFGPSSDFEDILWAPYGDVEVPGGIISLFENAVLTSPTGVVVTRSLIRITVKDGGLGDHDFAENGRIVIGPAAPASTLVLATDGGGSSSGSLNFYYLLLVVGLLAYRVRS